MQRVAVLGPERLAEPVHEGDDDRRREHGLRRDHRRRREQEAERAERPGTREQDVDHEPDDDRRQAEQRVHDDEPDLAPGEAIHGEHRAERRAEAEGEERRGEADAQRQADDRDELAVERAEKRQGESEGAAELLHRRLTRAARPRSGRRAARPEP